MSGYTCSCSVAELRLGLGRGGNSDTFSNSVDKALGCKLRGMSERQQPRAKILYTLTTGGMDPRHPGSALEYDNFDVTPNSLQASLQAIWFS